MRAFEGVEQDSVKMQNCPSVLFSFWCSPGRSYRRLGVTTLKLPLRMSCGASKFAH